jgi:hypothetical protein
MQGEMDDRFFVTQYRAAFGWGELAVADTLNSRSTIRRSQHRCQQPFLYHNTCILIHVKNPDLINLELELVESVASGKTPGGLEVFAQVVDLLDSGDERVIDGLDVSSGLCSLDPLAAPDGTAHG